MNDELSPEAKSLIDAAGDADLPSARDRARVRAKMALLIAGGAAGSQASHAAASAKVTAGVLGSKAALAVVVLGAVGAGIGIGVMGATERQTQGTAPALVRTASSTAAPAPASAPTPAVVTRSTDDAAPASPAPTLPATGQSESTSHRPREARATDRPQARAADHDWAADLQAEVALLSEAQHALAAGHPDAALDHLAQHRARFPRGALAQERLAATAIAHCQAGRHARGRALLADLPDESPLSSRAIDACRGAEH